MILGDVHEVITVTEVDPETYEEIYKVMIYRGIITKPACIVRLLLGIASDRTK